MSTCDPSSAVQLALLLLHRIIQFDSQGQTARRAVELGRHRVIASWALDIDKLMRIDGQPAGVVRQVIEWATKDSFWAPNILSGKKLRAQFERLTRTMKSRGVGVTRLSPVQARPVEPPPPPLFNQPAPEPTTEEVEEAKRQFFELGRKLREGHRAPG